MDKLTTAACAFALALAWGLAPAAAQTTSAGTEQKADQIEKKAEQKADQIEKQADQKADQVRKEGDRAADQARGKNGQGESAGDKLDRAWDKTKATARDAKDEVTGRDGAASADVREAQVALKEKGFDPGPIDGIMGPRTSAAVREFQDKENLRVTGQLDAETRAKLDGGAPSASPSASDKAGSQQGQKQ
jgi:hypothetical protein